MSDLSVNNKKIAQNTLYMYIRMSITMLVQLYTSRIVLNALGIVDYGIYNIVGSVIVAFSFLSGPLGTATQRFYNFELGRGNRLNVNTIFNHSLIIYSVLSVILLLVIESAGLWFIYNQMQLPAERLDAALWVFHLSVLGFVFGLLKIPFESFIVAHEKMSFYAYLSIVEVLLKLMNAFSLLYITVDKLKLYSVNQLVITWIVLGCMVIYCKRQFVYIRLQRMWNAAVFRQLLGFSGWSLFGSVASMSANQGLNILLNVFYGVAVNAAMGVANQVGSAVNQFVTNFQIAFRPQIVKSYAAGNLTDLKTLISRTSKYSYFLLFALACPLCFNIDFVLKVWLNTVPEYTSVFCIFILIYALLETLSAPMWMTVQATGRIRTYQLVISSIIGLNIFVSYAFLKSGFPPIVVLQVKCCLDVVYLAVRLAFMRSMVSYSVRYFLKEVLLPVCVVSALSLSVMSVVVSLVEDDLCRLLTSCISFVLVYVPVCYLWGMSRNERQMLLGFIDSKIRKNKK